MYGVMRGLNKPSMGQENRKTIKIIPIKITKPKTKVPPKIKPSPATLFVISSVTVKGLTGLDIPQLGHSVSAK